MTKLITVFCNFANTPKNAWPVVLHMCTSAIMKIMDGEVYAG
jgi:hypothetical protein